MSVFLWSSARIGGEKVVDLVVRRGIKFDESRRAIEHDVRYANITIIEGIGASQYGIGMVTARMAEAVLMNERAVVPASSYSSRHGVTLSLPSVVGRDGVVETLWPEMSEDEAAALEKSAGVLKNAVSNSVLQPYLYRSSNNPRLSLVALSCPECLCGWLLHCKG